MTDEHILIDIPLPIQTPRLILRAAAAGDGPHVHEAKMETWDMLHEWMPWAKEKESADADEINARKAHAEFILRRDIRISGFDRVTGQYVIGTGLHRFDWEKRRFEIGYWVRKSAQGKGIAQEAANALTRFAFNALAARAVAIDVAEGNEASMAVARRLGFRKEGETACDIVLPSGEVVTRHVFVRTDLEGLPPLDVRWGPP